MQQSLAKENVLEILFVLLSIVLIVLGVAGTLFPALPGLPLMMGGFLLLAWTDQFRHLGSTALLIMAVLTVVGLAIDFVAGLLGARITGASKQALWGAFIGSITGLFLGLPGVILGPLLGAAIGELLARRDAWQAGRVGLGTLAGFLIGTVAKLGCAFAMLATALFAWFW
jgi:uncharacterized protein YqgC (DUF456 family)